MNLGINIIPISSINSYNSYNFISLSTKIRIIHLRNKDNKTLACELQLIIIFNKTKEK